jgi:hypothetical protein
MNAIMNTAILGFATITRAASPNALHQPCSELDRASGLSFLEIKSPDSAMQ